MSDKREVAALLDAWHDRGDVNAAAQLRRRLAVSAEDRAAYWRWVQVHRALRTITKEQIAERSGQRFAQRRRTLFLQLLAAAVLVAAILLWGSSTVAQTPAGWVETDAGRRALHFGETTWLDRDAVVQVAGARIAVQARSAITCPASGFPVLALDAGRVQVQADTQPAQSPLVFQLPRVQVEVVGTEFILATDGDADLVQVQEGTVHCRSGAFAGLAITAGRQGRFADGDLPHLADTPPDGSRSDPVPIRDLDWRLMERHAEASRRSGTPVPSLDYILQAPPGTEAWAALLADPQRPDWSDASGMEITYHAPPVAGVTYWFEVSDSPRRGEQAGQWQSQVVSLPASPALQTLRIPFADFHRRFPAPTPIPPRWDAIQRCGFGADALDGRGSGRIIVSELRLYR